MSLRTRIVGLIGAVLLISIVLGSVFAGLQAKRALSAEIQAGVRGGAQTLASAFEDLPRSDHPSRDLTQLVATFDGNRHVSASLIDVKGQVEAVSRRPRPTGVFPGWFAQLMTPEIAPVSFPVPGSAGGFTAIALRATPDADLAAAWAELSAVATVLLGAAVFGATLAFFAVGAALAPLRDLSANFVNIGQGDYRSRVRERGPAEIVRLERSFNDMAARLAAMRTRNWNLEQQLLTLQDEERAELARDLHDDIGAHLYAVSLDAQLISELLAAGRPDAIDEQVGAIQSAVAHVQREVRAMVVRLRPARATELGLARAVEDLVRFWQARRPEVEFRVRLLRNEAALLDGVKDTVFRVVQEAVNNALRHATPTLMGIDVERSEDGGVAVEVWNDGVAANAPDAAAGFGLIGMRERVGTCGGRLTVGSRHDGTWSVSAVLPARARGADPAVELAHT